MHNTSFICLFVCGIFVIVSTSYRGLSTTNLAHLASYEDTIVKKLKSGVISSKIEHLKNEYLHDYNMGRGNLKTRDVAGNPIASYTMIRRYVVVLKTFLNADIISELIEQAPTEMQWPDEHDLFNAEDVVLRLQYTYDIDANEMSTGFIGLYETGVTMTSSQIMDLAVGSLESNVFTLSKEWILLAIARNISGSRELWDPLVEIHDKSYANELERADNPYGFEHPLSTHPNSVPMKISRMQRWRHGGEEARDNPIAQHYTTLALCSEVEGQRTGWILGGCYFDYSSPLYPNRVERLLDDGGLLIFRDFMPPHWIKPVMKSGLRGIAEQSPPDDWEEGRPSKAQFVWVNETVLSEDNVWVSKKIEMFTGLKVTANSSEHLRVLTYGLGGQLSPHYDGYDMPSQDNGGKGKLGDQVATLLIYLTDVEFGGATIFPIVGVTVQPQKGDALFFYSRLKNGQLDKRWLHSACPVAVGVKWTATKWMKHSHNVFNHKCDVDSKN